VTLRAVAVGALLLALPQTVQAAPLDELFGGCQARTSPDGAGHRICTAHVPSFDGTALDTTLTLPARAPRRGLPLVVFLHGFLTDKSEYLSETAAGTGPDRGDNAYKTVEWNNVWFASRGYAVLNYSARGQGNSGGQMGLASRELEVRDTRYLTGLLVDDPRLRLRPRRVAVLGSSYGGGQAWLLLTTRGEGSRQYGAWRSPGGRRIRLAAVVPQFTWTNLLQALLPNGRETDTPLGIGKVSIVDGLTATANTKLPSETLGWIARLNAGEPYDDPSDPVIPEAKRALSEDRSAAYQRGFFDALGAGPKQQRSVPVLAAQGWTDPIFPVSEALWMYRRLRAIRRGYPVKLYLGDFEHLTAAVKVPEFRYFHRLGNRLLDRYLRRKRKLRVRFDARSAPTLCDPQAFGPVVVARRFGLLGPERVTLELGGPRQLASPIVEPRGAATEPVSVSMARGRGCVTTDLPPTGGVGTYDVPLERGFTLVGMPQLRLRYRTLAPDVQLNSRLWDVAPSGVQTLVTRGAYRAVRPDPNGAEADYPLFGNHWRFEAGHTLRLEVANVDSPYLRQDNFPAVTTVDDARLVLPGRD
jgi:ABC-2 type transport system ATP-binding protein